MEKSGLSKYLVIALLIGGAFYLGSLNKRVSTLEKGTKNSGTTATVKDTGANNDAEVPAAFSPSDLVALAKDIGLNSGDFEKCLTSDEAKKEVVDESAVGSKAGVTGTPGVFIYDNQTGNIARIPGAVPYTMLKPVVEKMIAGLSEADKTVDSTGIEYTDKNKLTLPAIVSTDYVKGNKDARFTLIEYSDIDCPFCKRFHPTAQQLVDEYNGQVSWVYRQFPLDQLHPNARVKAQGARCAGKLGGAEAFWKYLDDVAQ